MSATYTAPLASSPVTPMGPLNIADVPWPSAKPWLGYGNVPKPPATVLTVAEPESIFRISELPPSTSQSDVPLPAAAALGLKKVALAPAPSACDAACAAGWPARVVTAALCGSIRLTACPSICTT